MVREDLDRERSMSPLVATLIGIALIGALNWGLIGIFNWNLVDAIFGGGAREATSTGSRVVYTIVGLSALASIPFLLARREAMSPA